MPKFVFAYHGGKKPDNPADGEKVMAAWNAWYGSIGEDVVDGGGPCGPSQTVSSSGVADNGGANPLSGLTQISAPDMQSAIGIAKRCPILDDGGSVEVAEVLEM